MFIGVNERIQMKITIHCLKSPGNYADTFPAELASLGLEFMHTRISFQTLQN